MHKIYFENRAIIICPPGDEALSDPNAVEFLSGGPLDIHTLVGMFEVSGSLSRIYIPSEDIEKTYHRVQLS